MFTNTCLPSNLRSMPIVTLFCSHDLETRFLVGMITFFVITKYIFLFLSTTCKIISYIGSSCRRRRRMTSINFNRGGTSSLLSFETFSGGTPLSLVIIAATIIVDRGTLLLTRIFLSFWFRITFTSNLFAFLSVDVNHQFLYFLISNKSLNVFSKYLGFFFPFLLSS